MLLLLSRYPLYPYVSSPRRRGSIRHFGPRYFANLCATATENSLWMTHTVLRANYLNTFDVSDFQSQVNGRGFESVTGGYLGKVIVETIASPGS